MTNITQNIGWIVCTLGQESEIETKLRVTGDIQPDDEGHTGGQIFPDRPPFFT